MWLFLTQVSIAVSAEDFRSDHSEGSVGVSDHVVGPGGLEEARPAGAGIELVVGGEQVGLAASALVHACRQRCRNWCQVFK